MMLVIDTQDRENYAAHQGFTGEYYWKMKGGQSYKVINIPQGADPAKIVETFRSDIEDLDNDYYRSEIIEYSLQPDDWMSPFERSQLEYEGALMVTEPTFDYSKVMANAH
jgi:hypothetical protein